MAAALSGSIEVLQVLREAGCDVNHRGSGGNRPLHLAASRSHADAVRWLLQSGADADARNDSGFTALGVVLELQAAKDEVEEDEDEDEGDEKQAAVSASASSAGAGLAVVEEGKVSGDGQELEPEVIDPDDETVDPVIIIAAVLQQASSGRGGLARQEAPEVVQAARAIAAGGPAAHLPPVPAEMDATADRLLEEALAAADAIAERRTAEGKPPSASSAERRAAEGKPPSAAIAERRTAVGKPPSEA